MAQNKKHIQIISRMKAKIIFITFFFSPLFSYCQNDSVLDYRIISMKDSLFASYYFCEMEINGCTIKVLLNYNTLEIKPEIGEKYKFKLSLLNDVPLNNNESLRGIRGDLYIQDELILKKGEKLYLVDEFFP